MKLSKAQLETLYSMETLRRGCLARFYNKNTLQALERRGLIRFDEGIGVVFVYVTEAGRAALDGGK